MNNCLKTRRGDPGTASKTPLFVMSEAYKRQEIAQSIGGPWLIISISHPSVLCVSLCVCLHKYLKSSSVFSLSTKIFFYSIFKLYKQPSQKWSLEHTWSHPPLQATWIYFLPNASLKMHLWKILLLNMIKH